MKTCQTKAYMPFLLLLLIFLPAAILCAGDAPDSEAQGDTSGDVAPIREFPFEITSNKPFVQVRVNDSDPLWFILDTGSGQGSLIDRERAIALGLKWSHEEEQHMGAGEGAIIKASWTTGVDFDIHGEALLNQSAMIIPFTHVAEYEGRALDGTIGANFLSLYVVEIDYPSETIRLYKPGAYVYSGTGRAIPFEFIGGLPAIQCAIYMPDSEPVTGRFVVDTGTRMAILINTPFVEKHRLLETNMKFLAGTVGGGVGGESKGYVGRIDKMHLGPFMVNKPIATFSQDTSGVAATSAFDGIIGGEILRRCKVILDYSRRLLILEPGSGPPTPYEYDMSGMFLIAKAPDYKQLIIQSVIEGSPADKAGLLKGDIITAIDGRPAGEFILEHIRRLFKEEGREFAIEIKRGDEELEVSIQTERLI
jgi:hypothetical protein